MDNQAKPYAAVIVWNDPGDGDGISVQEYFRTQHEAEAWVRKQKHDPERYEWGVMKYE